MIPVRNIFFIISLFAGLCYLAGCSDKENAIIEKKYTGIELSAYTVDTMRLRVSLNENVITDSLITPEGKVPKVIFFDAYRQNVKVFNTSDETLLLDTFYTLKTGKTNVFTLYQTETNTPPVYLAPPPGEPLAATGYSKLSIIYAGADLPESVKIVVENPVNNGPLTPTDSFILKKNTFSKYFEVMANKTSYLRISDVNGNPIGSRSFLASMLNPDFTISRLTKAGSSSFVVQKLY